MSSSINQLIINKILSVYNELNNKQDNKINITNFYTLYADKLMYKIINKKLSEEEFIMLINLAISFYKKKKRNTKSNERKAIMPYRKWHYKFIINLNKKEGKKKEEKID